MALSQPISTSTGTDARTNVLYAIERLKAKSPQPIPSSELISFIYSGAVAHQDPQRIALFSAFLKNNDKVRYDPGTDSYTFRPHHNIFTAEDLLSYLQKQDSALGISVKDLKDGWGDVEKTINKLEAEHRLLVTRHKKDNQPRMVWADDPTLHTKLDEEYKDLWAQIAVPESHEDVMRALKTENLRPAGAEKVKPVKAPGKKKKPKRTGHKVTNTHMKGLLKDFSDRAPKATANK